MGFALDDAVAAIEFEKRLARLAAAKEKYQAEAKRRQQKANPGIHFDFVRRILRDRVIDTKAYRYVAKTIYGLDREQEVVYRLPIRQLGTAAALWPGQWEEIYRLTIK